MNKTGVASPSLFLSPLTRILCRSIRSVPFRCDCATSFCLNNSRDLCVCSCWNQLFNLWKWPNSIHSFSSSFAFRHAKCVAIDCEKLFELYLSSWICHHRRRPNTIEPQSNFSVRIDFISFLLFFLFVLRVEIIVTNMRLVLTLIRGYSL